MVGQKQRDERYLNVCAGGPKDLAVASNSPEDSDLALRSQAAGLAMSPFVFRFQSASSYSSISTMSKSRLATSVISEF